MGLSAYMTKEVITVCIDDDLTIVKAKFEKYKLHHLLVIDDNNVLCGVITDRDLFKHLSPVIGTIKETLKDTALLRKKCHQIMCRNLVTAKVDDTINEAIISFYENHISCLPIVDNENKPIGIITWRDIIKTLALQYKKKASIPAQ